MRSALRIYSFFPSAEILAEASFVFLSSPLHYLPAGGESSSQSINLSHHFYCGAALWAWCKRFLSRLPAAPCSRTSCVLSPSNSCRMLFPASWQILPCAGHLSRSHLVCEQALSSRGPPLPQKRCDTNSVRCQVIPEGLQWVLTPAASPVG